MTAKDAASTICYARVDTPTSKEETWLAEASLFPWDPFIAPLLLDSGAHPGVEPSLFSESF